MQTVSIRLVPTAPIRRGASERVGAILDAADRVLTRIAISDVKLLDISTEAGIAKATIYHFFPSSEAVLVGLLRRYLSSMDETVAHKLANAPQIQWQALIRSLFESVRSFYVTHPICAELVFRTGGFGGLQATDDKHIDEWARFACQVFAARYHVPHISQIERRVAIALAISDRIWAMDIRDGIVSDFIFEESQRAIIAYLANFLPPMMTMRDEGGLYDA